MYNILIVDDDEEICTTLKEIFEEEEDYQAEYVTSGEEALKVMNEKNYDVVISDLMMPKVSGMDLLTSVKRNQPDAEVVMITAFGSVENAVEAMKKGAVDYIEKPFKLSDIRTSIKRVLEEAKFKKKYKVMLEEAKDEEVGKILKNIANPIRRNALYSIYNQDKMSFTSIKNEHQISDPTKLSFHLRQLKSFGLVAQDGSRKYYVTPKGEKIIDILKAFGAI